MIELKVTSSLDTPNWTCISLELAPEASHQRQQCGNMCQSLHWPRHGLSRLGLTTDGCKKLYLMDWKILEVNISDHDDDVDPSIRGLVATCTPGLIEGIRAPSASELSTLLQLLVAYAQGCH